MHVYILLRALEGKLVLYSDILNTTKYCFNMSRMCTIFADLAGLFNPYNPISTAALIIYIVSSKRKTVLQYTCSYIALMCVHWLVLYDVRHRQKQQVNH